MADVELSGPVVLFDDDHYYMGAVLAEKLQTMGLEVTLVTPTGSVGEGIFNTEEQARTQRRLLNLGVNILTGKAVNAIDGNVDYQYFLQVLRHHFGALNGFGLLFL
jgi:dimethylamine/trimethylamine dehydrogenase